MANAARFTSYMKFLAAAAAASLTALGVLLLARFGGAGMPAGAKTALAFLLLGLIFAGALWANALLLQNLAKNSEAAREAEEKYRLAFDHAAIGIAHVGLDGRWLEFNGKLLEIVGYSSSELAQLTFKDITHPADLPRDQAHFQLLLSGEETSYVTEKRYIRKSGEFVWIRLSVALVRREDGTPRYFISVVEDITSRKRMDQERAGLLAREHAALEASRLKSEFLAMMSHEIRTPINGVLGMAGLLADTRLTSEQKEYAEGIQRSAESLLSVLNDVLDLSKIEAGKLDFEEVDFDLLTTLKDAERILRFPAEQKKLSLSLQVDERVPRLLKGDPGRLRQILMNLVGNAVKFTTTGGVTIRVSLAQEPEQEPEEQITIRVEVEDTGIGIPAEAQSRLFEAFTQADASMSRRFGGSGLGLSICRHLVSRMGGEIAVRSEEGKGSLFWFTARFAPGKGSPRSLNEAPQFTLCPGLRKATLLVAEDNAVNQTIIIRTLQKLGLKAEAVSSGHEVIAALQRSDYAMILMDCQMPGMDGYEATRAIRAKTTRYGAGIPIIAMTANAYQEDRERCLAAGMNDYLSKPVKTSKLAVVLEKWLAKPAREKYCLSSCGAHCQEPFRETGAAPREACAAVIDPAALDALREVDSGREGLVIELIERFLADLPGRLERMETDLGARDGRILRREAHQLKSSGASLGARDFARLCAEIEELAMRRDWPRLETTFGLLKREFPRVQEALARELETARVKAA